MQYKKEVIIPEKVILQFLEKEKDVIDVANHFLVPLDVASSWLQNLHKEGKVKQLPPRPENVRYRVIN